MAAAVVANDNCSAHRTHSRLTALTRTLCVPRVARRMTGYSPYSEVTPRLLTVPLLYPRPLTGYGAPDKALQLHLTRLQWTRNWV